VDYAHTPDALDKVLSSLRQHCKNKIWVVFGCGGNRDTGKRPMMRAAAEHWADRVIITDDNPRFESNEAIVNEILAGGAASQTEVIHDRKQAIEAAISGASSGDCVLIAGKGHEDYQEIAGVRLPFSDREVVLDLLRG
jgi:UDP-N-acetylmuramoyl-L-alanyl-D-glutamate--2,6-diaminopimelate ligase